MNVRPSILQKFLSFNFLPFRTCNDYPKRIKYPGFYYYPRTENFQDPPYEPSKLLFVKRYKSVKGTTEKEKQILKILNIDGEKKDGGHITVVKNTPSVNASLWKIKHLVQIKPITWKGELPKDGDFSGTYLRETGELIISHKLGLSSEQLEKTQEFLKDPKYLGRMYIREYLRKKWDVPLSGHI